MNKSRSPLYVTTLIAGAFFMENLDGTIIATALPQMARSFHASAVSLNLGITAYLLTLAVFIPISGWVADRFGSRSIFAAAIATFTLSSLLCGASHTLTEFTLMRILQGIGGAMMVPVGRLIVLRTTPKDKLTEAIAYITWPGLTALVVGPPLGGFITTYASWHWIFFLNLPLGIIALILTMLWVENVRAGDKHPFDWLTFLLAGFASAGAVYGMEKLGSEGVAWQIPGLVLALSALSGIAAIVAAHRNPATSLIDLESMKLKTYSLSVYGGSAFRMAASVLPFLLPLMFQIAFRVECVSIRPLSARALRRRPDDEGIRNPGSSPFRFSPIAYRERNHYRGVHGALRVAHAGYCEHSGGCHSVFPRSLAIDAVHLHDDACVRGDSAGQDEPGQWVSQRRDAAQHGYGCGHRRHHPAAGCSCARSLSGRAPAARLSSGGAVHGFRVSWPCVRQP